MKKFPAILAIAILAVPALALAQTAPSDPETNLVQDWQAIMIAQKHAADDINALVQEAKAQKKQIDDLTKQLSDLKKPATQP